MMSGISRRSDRRAFLGGILATGAVLPGASAFGQEYDPYTGQLIYGDAPTSGAPDLGRYQVDPNADARRNQSSFTARHWSDFYPSLGKGVVLADITSRSLHYWSGDQSTYMVFPCSIPMTEDLTRRGQTEIVRKMKDPPWTPTPSMREKDPNLPARVAGGSPDNPLGAYGLYLAWPAYLLHGTHDTRKIGRKSSSGCYGLYNEHVTKLYEMADIGTQVTIF